MEGNQPIVPTSGDQEIDQLYGMLEMNADKLQREQPDVWDGLLDAIEEYASFKQSKKEVNVAGYSNPLEYYEAKKKGQSVVDTRQYYDVANSNTSNIDRRTMYKMFANQVVSELKKGNIITLPETWDIGAHFTATAKDALGVVTQNSNIRDLDRTQLSDTLNSEFVTTMQERIDYLANNTKSSDLFKMFNEKTIDKYQYQPKSNFDFVMSTVGKFVGNDDLKPSAETNTAGAFNNIIQSTAQYGRKIGGDAVFDWNNNIVETEPYSRTTNPELISNKFYQQGREAALTRPKEGLDSYMRNYPKDTKGVDWKAFEEGFYDRMNEEGATVVRNKATGFPQALGKININMGYKDGKTGYSVNVGDGEPTDYINLPQGMRDYVDRVDFMRRITGSLSTALTQVGGGSAPLK